MTRSPRSALLAFILPAALAAAVAASPPARSTGQIESALERSTAQVETAVESLPIVESKTLAFAAGATSAAVEGTISRRGPVAVVLSPVPRGMLDIGVAARTGPIWMSVFRDGAERPEPGTEPASRSIRWISSADGAARLRIVAYSGGDETPFRVSVRATAASAGD